MQTARFREHPGIYCNAQMTPALLKKCCALDEACTGLLKIAMQRFGLSARAYDRIIKLSRTISDLQGVERITPQHIAEAIQYRSLDREGSRILSPSSPSSSSGRASGWERKRLSGS